MENRLVVVGDRKGGGGGREWVFIPRKSNRSLSEVGEEFCISVMVVVTGVYTLAKIA